MRTHLQGITLLALLLAAVWGAVQLASPALSSALGEDGAVVAESSDDRIDLTADSEPEAPLTDPEKLRLQFNLLRGGFFEDINAVDGYIGPGTRKAMAEAAQAWGLDAPSDRELFDHTELLYADQLFLD
jgi:hypothetical protein